MNTEPRIHIGIDLRENILLIKVTIGNTLLWYDEAIQYPGIDSKDLVFWLLLNRIKPVFDSMPHNRISVNHSPAAVEQFGDKIQQVLFALDKTNQVMNRYKNLKQVAETHSNGLVFNVDSSIHYTRLYDYLKKDNKTILYENMDSGFDRANRQWLDSDVPFPIDDLITYICENKIKKIITVNMYLLDKYLFKEGIYLQGLLEFLGVELITIEQDEYDLGSWTGYYYRSFFNNNKCIRYSISMYTSAYWDKQFNHTNTLYMSSLKNCKAEYPDMSISQDYKILLLTNSRIQNTKSLVPSFLYIMDHIDTSELFPAFQLWFVSLRYLILNVMNLDINEKLVRNNQLFSFFYNCYQILKYETIYNIRTSRPIEIYGDKGWAELFPQYYQNKYLSSQEADQMLRSKNHLLVIPNWSISWLSRDWNIYDSLVNDVPFITAASIAMPSEFKSLEQVEFSNSAQMNHLIENIDSIYSNDDFKEAVYGFKQLLSENYKKASTGMMSEDPQSYDYGNQKTLILESKKILKNRIHQYIDKNEGFLRESFDVLFLGKQTSFNVAESRLGHRPYIQALLNL